MEVVHYLNLVSLTKVGLIFENNHSSWHETIRYSILDLAFSSIKFKIIIREKIKLP